MTITDDTQKLLGRCDEVRLDLTKARKRGWDHMGAVIVDSALQRRRKYASVVLPRVRKVVDALPGKKSTSDFAKFSASTDLNDFLPWKGKGRIEQMHETVRVLVAHGVDTTEGFAKLLEDPTSTGESLRRDLGAIKGIGPKTMDYFRILVGLDWRAVDTRIKDFARDADIADRSYPHLAEVLDTAAKIRGVAVGFLDAAIWEYESSK